MGQFKALSVKNWILFKRSPLGSVLEIALPIIFAMFLILVRRLATVETFDQQQYLSNSTISLTHYGTVSVPLNITRPTIIKNCIANGKIVALAPTGDPMVDQLSPLLTGFGYRVLTYPSDDQIDRLARDPEYGLSIPEFCFGVSFENSGTNYRYNLRFNISNGGSTEGPSPTTEITTRRNLNLVTYTRSLASGFIGLTNIINNMILTTVTGNSSNMLVNKVGPIYQEQYVSDPVYNFLSNSAEFIILLPLLIVYLRQTSAMLEEKEKKIRESMSITGMKLWIYYATWFLRYFAVYLIIHLVISGIVTGVFPKVPYYVPLVMFLLFDVLLIIQSFFIQIFVTRAKIGIIFALLFFVLQYVINYIIANNSDPTIRILQAVSVVPHVAFILAFKTMLFAESVKTTIGFGDYFNQYTVATALVSFIINIIVWTALTWYLDQVFPNEWGAKKHPCFCCVGQKNHVDDNTNRQIEPSLSNDKFEKDPQIESVEGKYKEMENNKKAILIKNLKKTFNGEIHAVKDLSMSMYADQIFVLLGHNGAGKTTTISMLTGMVERTSGIIEVMGATELDEIRAKIGVCPQHDTLYEDLTVEEHIRLFSTFRGLEGEELDEEVDKLVRDVNLEEKKNEYSKNLSGGQKRRLSVAMAFSGGAKVIILDEPTSGMDTSARRYIWEMLKNYKNDRIILLTTHFMDEADYLGDRIAIMSGGRLVALGSNVYLKNKFGVGYNITFVKKSIDVKSEPIIEIVRKYVITASVLSNVSSELAIQLPMDQIGQFGKLFGEVDAKKQQLGIETYGISITTLEEVFLKVAEEEEQRPKNSIMQNSYIDSGNSSPSKLQKDAAKEDKVVELPKSNSNIEVSQVENFEEETWVREDAPCERFLSHMLATILKRFRVIKRDLKSFIFELILPMLIIILALLLMRVSFVRDWEKQELTFKLYENETRPTLVPIGSSAADSTILNDLKAEIETAYPNQIRPSTYTVANDLLFDSGPLFTEKQKLTTLKGGIYFQAVNYQSGMIPFTTIVNTRSPTTLVTMQTLAAETYINYLNPGANIKITPVNKALPRTYRQLRLNNAISGFFGALIFSIALAFKFASIVSFIVKERQDKSKHQQIVSGLNIVSYWLGNYIFDLILYLILAIFSVAMCQALKIQSLITGNAFTGTCLLFFLFGLTNIPLTYIMGYLFRDYGNAQGAIYFFNFVSGGILTIIILVLRWIDQNSNQVGRGLAWLLRIIPSFAFGEGLVNMGSISLISVFENGGRDMDPLAIEVSLAPIIYLAVFFFIYGSCVFILEYLQNNENFMRCFSRESKYQQVQPIEDEDVLAEQKKALAADPKDYEILTKNLRKVYTVDSQKKYKVAVDNLSFGVNKGEVFGLLGVNGAGKTTTFKMLAGEVVSTSGESYFNGYKISEHLPRVRKNLGYCPQFDALIENLTVQEQLQLFYDMKCLPKAHKKQAIARKIKEMNLQQYRDKLSGTLSGGNKRKLSVAMAMIGNPSIIFLDEPSTGMDPKARRFMWKIISRISTERKQSTVILTTHAMEEAEALSTRLGIMVNGNFKCIGTPQQIKSKFGKGFEIEVKIKNIKRDQIDNLKSGLKINSSEIVKADLPALLETLKASEQTKKAIDKYGSASYIWQDLQSGKRVSTSSVLEFHLVQQKVYKIEKVLKQSLGEAEILEHFQTFVRFKTGTSVSVGKMFELLQSKKAELSIMQYSIKQATVEQIFNKFAEEDGNAAMD